MTHSILLEVGENLNVLLNIENYNARYKNDTSQFWSQNNSPFHQNLHIIRYFFVTQPRYFLDIFIFNLFHGETSREFKDRDNTAKRKQ